MSGEMLCRALEGISDEKLESALTVYTRRKKSHAWLFRIAAVAAAVLLAIFWLSEKNGTASAPGILKAYAYDLNSGTEIETMESRLLKCGESLPEEYGWNLADSSVQGLMLTLKVDGKQFSEEEVKFDISLSHGAFYAYSEGTSPIVWDDVMLGRNIQIYSNEPVVWRISKDMTLEQVEKEHIYIDIVIYVGDEIRGCAVLEVINKLPERLVFQYQLIYEETFVDSDGKEEKVTKDDAIKRMEQHHK